MKFYFRVVAREFMESLDERIRNRINRKLELYGEYGLNYILRSSYLKKFSEDLYEVIVMHDYRFLGTMINEDFYLVIGFQKKSQKTPYRMIQYAINIIKKDKQKLLL